MLHENEIIMLGIGLAILVFVLINYSQLKHTPSFKLLFISYCLSTTGWLLTVLEGFFWGEYLNLLEHLCYASGTIMLAVWCWIIPGKSREMT